MNDGLSIMTRNWWMLALRGVLAIVFAMVAFFLPGVTLAALIILFGAYALIDGLFAIGAGVASVRKTSQWWVLLVEGMIGVVIGGISLFWPIATALVLLAFIAAWAILTGILEIAAAIYVRSMIQGEWMLGLTGVISLILGVLLMALPVAGLIVWTWIIGVYALVYGILLVALSVQLHRHGSGHTGGHLAGQH